MRARPDRLRRAAAAPLALLALLAGGLLTSCSGQETASSSTTTGTKPPPETTTTTEVPLEQGEQIYVYNPKIGDCFDKRKVPGQDKKLNDIVLLVTCDLPHEYEVYALVEYPLPDAKTEDPKARDYPEDELLRKFARAECPKAYEAYVGQRYELSKLEIAYLMPAKANWPSNRTIGCDLYDPTGNKRAATAKDTKA